MRKLDRLDLKLLGRIQTDASTPLSELGREIGLSTNACWKRLKRLDDEGFVEARVALLNRRKLGLNVTAFVTVRTDEHNDEWAKRFADSVSAIPEVVEFYRMAGEVDYMLKVVCSDIEDYDRIYKRIIRSVRLRDVSAFFAMEQLKFSTEIPLSQVRP